MGMNYERYLKPLLIVLFVFSLQHTATAQTSLTIEPPLPSRMMVGDEVTVKVKVSPAPNPAIPIDQIQWSLEGCLEIKTKSDAEGGGVYSFTFKATKPCDTVQLSVKVRDLEQKFTLAVVPLINKDTLSLSPAPVANPPMKITQQSEKTVKLKLKDNTPIPSGALKAATDSQDTVLASLANANLVLTGRKPGTAKITISAFDKDVVSFDVQVVEAVQEIKATDLTFTNGDAAKALSDLGIELVGKEGTVWKKEDATSRLNFFALRPSVAKLSADGKNLEIVDAGDAQLQMTAKDNPSNSKVINITVRPKASHITFSTGNLTVLEGAPSVRVTATVKDSAARLVPNAVVKFDCQGQNCHDIVGITPLQDNTVEIKGKKAGTVLITAVVEGQADVKQETLTVDVIGSGQITTFKPLVIRLDMIDDQAARDLFGRKANDEYYIAKVQLFNNLKKTDSEFFGDSILVYSESLQVRVALEVKCRPNDGISRCTNNIGRWIPVSTEMIEASFLDHFNLSPPLSQTEPQSTENPKCIPQAPKGFVGLYRPYSFDTIAVTHDRRDERSARSRILTVLNGAISFTSFITAIAVPGPGSDLPLGLDKSNNLLIPSFEKLFPSMKEVQRQNILTMVMRNLEEIPFGGNLERKIFFPKGALEGLWPGHRVRISGVSTFDACAEVAIVKKVNQ